MAVQAENTHPRRRHSAGQATRELLMVTAERLIAMNGVEGVTLREIQAAAGQSNSSVITYHFGSQAGLVRALLEFRYRKVNARRAELLKEAREQGMSGDPRAAVWLIVRPLIESIEAGEMFVPFLARVSANHLVGVLGEQRAAPQHGRGLVELDGIGDQLAADAVGVVEAGDHAVRPQRRVTGDAPGVLHGG